MKKQNEPIKKFGTCWGDLEAFRYFGYVLGKFGGKLGETFGDGLGTCTQPRKNRYVVICFLCLLIGLENVNKIHFLMF